MDGYITTDEVAQRLGVKVETVRRWIRQGKLPGLPLGRAGYRIRREDFDRFVQQPEHLRSEPSPSEREGQFSTLVEHLPDVVFRLDVHLRHLYVSPKIEAVTGQPPAAWLGKTGREMGLPAEVCDLFEALCQEAISTGREQSMEFNYQNGWNRSRIIPEYASDSTISALMGITEDITEYKRRELRTALITDFTETISHLSTQEEILQVAGERMRQYFDVSSLTAANVNEASNEFTLIYDSAVQSPANVFQTQRLSDFANEDFLREMKAERVVVVNDFLIDPRTAPAAGDFAAFPVRAFVLASHVSNGHVDFVLGMQHREPYTWRKDEIDLLRELLARIYPQLERVRAESALRESRAEAERQRRFFEKIFDNLSSSVFIWNREHRYVYINRTLEKLWGIEHGSAVGKTTVELGLNYPPETGKLITSQVEHVFETGEDVISEMPYTSPGGVNGYFEYTFSPVFSADGAVEFVAGISQDISRRKRMEQALRDSEQRVQAERQRLYDLFMTAPAAIMVIRGPQHVYELANPLALQIMGTHRSIIGKPVREVLPEAEEQGFLDLLDAVYQTGKPFLGNEMLGKFDKNGDGRLVPAYFNFVYQPSYSALGEIDGILCYVNDVTETVESRKRVEESEERLRTLANSMPQLVWSATPGGEIDFFNEQLNKYAEIPKNEKGVYDWQVVIHPDDRENTKRVWEHAIRTGETFENEQRMQMKDETYRWHLVRGLPVQNEDGSLSRWYGTKTDIEQLKQLEQQRTDFLGVVSHELKTPVTSAKAFAEVLENRFRKAGDQKSASLLGKMNAQMEKLTRLISDLLDVTKIEAGRLQFYEEYFPFDTLVDDTLEEVQRTTTHTLQREGITGATIYGDRERIGQVLINLLTNALKYSPNASKVVVSTLSTEQEVTVCVQDFGIGIAQDTLPHVFERFFRETGAREDTFAGIGLGLYVASEIISRQGGKIWAESEKGQGSTFCFSLPIQGSKNTPRSNDMSDEGK